MYCKKKEKIASECLVICIGIAKYSQETHIPDIDDVCDDIKSYKSTFALNDNYTVISNDYNKIYTKQSLLNYFTLLFDENLYNSETASIKYNSLLITISGHCTDNSLIVSNGEKILFIEILSLFTENWKNKNLVINLPKFIIVDGQRGYDYLSASKACLSEEKQDDIAYMEAQMMGDEDCYITDTYSAVMCSVSNILYSRTFSGQLAWNLTQILSENIKKKCDIIFYDIIKQLRYRINKALDDYQFSIAFIEHDMDIDDVVFRAETFLTFSAVKDHKLTNKFTNMSGGYSADNIKEKNIRNRFLGRSASLGSLLRKKDKKKEQNENKSGKRSTSRFFKRTQSLSSFGIKRSKSQPPNKDNGDAVPEDEEINDIVRDPIFCKTTEWDKTVEVLSKTKEKVRVRIVWLFVLRNKSHNISLLHSQKIHDPYRKSKRVLFIDGKQSWSHKSNKQQLNEMWNGNAVVIHILFDEKEKQFNYNLKINNKSHKQQFQKWCKKQIDHQFIE